MQEVNIELILLLADALMLGVICCVQWIIYPSFLRMEPENLRAWHHDYSRRIALIVIPPMSLQLFGGSYRFWLDTTTGSGLYLGIILLLWALTFIKFVPLHRRIGMGTVEKEDLGQLVRLNGTRTLLWFLVFIIDLLLWMGSY